MPGVLARLGARARVGDEERAAETGRLVHAQKWLDACAEPPTPDGRSRAGGCWSSPATDFLTRCHVASPLYARWLSYIATLSRRTHRNASISHVPRPHVEPPQLFKRPSPRSPASPASPPIPLRPQRSPAIPSDPQRSPAVPSGPQRSPAIPSDLGRPHTVHNIFRLKHVFSACSACCVRDDNLTRWAADASYNS